MNLFLKILNNDLKLILRDKSLLIMFLLPFIIILVCRIGIPLLTKYVPATEEYYWLIVAGFTAVTASTPAFLIGFILLDERDENIHTILSILPLPNNFIVKTRIIFMMSLGFIFAILILSLNGLIHLSIFRQVCVSLLFALIPPVLTFAIVAFSKNKIEAATMYKGLSILIFIPIIAFFFPSDWKYSFGIIPFFWTYNSLQIANTDFWFLVNIFAGLVTHSVLAFLLYRIFQKRWFS